MRDPDYFLNYYQKNKEKMQLQASLSKQKCLERDLLDPEYDKKRLIKFMNQVEKKENGCWEWLGGKNKFTLYGISSYKGKLMGAHRLSYILFFKEIPKGLHIDHLCKNKICVNPEHLEAVTQKENLRRCGFGKGNNSSKCIFGHDYIFKTERVYGVERTVKKCTICTKYRKDKTNEKISIIDYENKLKIENLIKNQNKSILDDKTIREFESRYGESAFRTAVKLKMFELNLNCFSKNIIRAYKFLGENNISLEEFVLYYGFKPIRTRQRIEPIPE